MSYWGKSPEYTKAIRLQHTNIHELIANDMGMKIHDNLNGLIWSDKAALF